MKVFLISNMYPNEQYPGYGSFVKNVVEGLRLRGYDFIATALIVGRSTSLFDKVKKYIRFYLQILSGYFKKYDFIYVHFPNQSLLLLLPLYLFRPVKVIVNLHGEDLLYEHRGISWLLGLMNDYFLKKVDAVVVPSDYFKQIVLERIGCISSKLIVSPSGGIDKSCFFPSGQKKNDALLHLGYVGRIEEGKGWYDFIQILVSIPKSVHYKATIIGNGSQEKIMKTLLKEKGLERIMYISHIPQNKLRYYYSDFDLLVFTSSRREESLGLVGIEAMACGTPVLGSAIGGISSYLIDGYNGFLTPVGDLEQQVDAIMRFYSLSKEKKEQMKCHCLLTASKYYSNRVIDTLAEDIALAIKE